MRSGAMAAPFSLPIRRSFAPAGSAWWRVEWLIDALVDSESLVCRFERQGFLHPVVCARGRLRTDQPWPSAQDGRQKGHRRRKIYENLAPDRDFPLVPP